MSDLKSDKRIILENTMRPYINKNYIDESADDDFENIFQSWLDKHEEMEFGDYFMEKKRSKTINNIIK